MARIFLFLSLSVLACQPIRQIDDTKFTDQQRKRRFKLTSKKLAVLRRAANERLPAEYQDNPTLLKRYDYWPIVVDHHFRGLWHFDNYSHEGPIWIINGEKTATIIPLLVSKAATLDSLNAALQRYPLTEISPDVRAEIVKNISAIQFLQ